MRKIIVFVLSIFMLISCGKDHKAEIKNTKIHHYSFLEDMYTDDYFPNHLVSKAEQILISLCIDIEADKPKNSTQVLKLTHAATIEFNYLAGDFWDAGSELETVARESIARDIKFILLAYNFNVDIEKAISPRDW